MKIGSFDQMLRQRYAAVLSGGPIFVGVTYGGRALDPKSIKQLERAVVADVAGQMTAHKRSEHGHLLCQGPCGEPYPFADPPETGPFVCFGCRSET